MKRTMSIEFARQRNCSSLKKIYSRFWNTRVRDRRTAKHIFLNKQKLVMWCTKSRNFQLNAIISLFIFLACSDERTLPSFGLLAFIIYHFSVWNKLETDVKADGYLFTSFWVRNVSASCVTLIALCLSFGDKWDIHLTK